MQVCKIEVQKGKMCKSRKYKYGKIKYDCARAKNAIVQRRMLQCRYHRLKRDVLSRFLKMFTDGAVRQLSGREFQSLGAATEKRRAAMSMLCGGRKENSVLMIVTNATDCMGGSDEQGRPVDKKRSLDNRD